jgi:hypothetical protein
VFNTKKIGKRVPDFKTRGKKGNSRGEKEVWGGGRRESFIMLWMRPT